MAKYYNKELFNSTLDEIIGEVHLTVEVMECNKDHTALKIGLANKDGPVYIFDTYILNKGDKLDINSDNVKWSILDWVRYV